MKSRPTSANKKMESRNKKSFLTHIENLAEALAQKSMKHKNSSPNLQTQQKHHHQSEKSTSTVIDDILVIQPLNKVTPRHKHKKTNNESITAGIVESTNGKDNHHRKHSSIQIDKSYVSKLS